MAKATIKRFMARAVGAAILSVSMVGAVVITTGSSAGAVTSHTMRIDFTSVSVTQYSLNETGPNGWTNSVFDSTVVQTVNLPEGGYDFQVGTGPLLMSCDFTVSSAGTWTYDPSCGGFVKGTGTDSLTVLGYSITLDPSALSEVRLDFAHFYENSHLGTAPQTFNLVPTRSPYFMVPGGGLVSSCGFGVGLDGNVTLSAASQPCLSGAGTNTVVFHGFAVQIDARQLSTGGFLVDSFSPIFASNVVQTLTLLPLSIGTYEFEAVKGQLTFFRWNVDSVGNVTFPAADDAFASGRGTPSLLLTGLNVNVDATNLGPGMFDIKQLIGPDFDQSSVQVLRLVPGGYWFLSGPGGSVSLFVWTFGLDGLVGYTGSPTPCVSGRGTTTLVVGCVKTLTGRAFGISATSVIAGTPVTLISPFPDTGEILTTASGHFTKPCVNVPAPLAAHVLCVGVTTVRFPGSSTATASVANVTLTLPHLPVIVLKAVDATSQTSCGGSTGSTIIAYLKVGNTVVIANPTSIAPNTTLTVGVVRLVLNEQTPIPGGLRVNAVHVSLGASPLANADVIVSSAASDIHNCP